MKVLLDTSAFLRWTSNSSMPGAVTRRLARNDTECFVSIVTAWEIAIKKSLGRSAVDVEAAVYTIGAQLLPLRFTHLDQLDHLAHFTNHRDPFDRLLIAQAVSQDLTMISSDQRFRLYPQLRLLWD